MHLARVHCTVDIHKYNRLESVQHILFCFEILNYVHRYLRRKCCPHAHKALLLASYLYSEDIFFECHVQKCWKDILTESIEFTAISLKINNMYYGKFICLIVWWLTNLLLVLFIWIKCKLWSQIKMTSNLFIFGPKVPPQKFRLWILNLENKFYYLLCFLKQFII